MALGWIDFSKSERSKVLSVLDLLSENGTLDELGIAPIRDGFSNMFFPGTSTIQTRAKYFLIVPYALKDMELSPEDNYSRLLREFNRLERFCGEQLIANGAETEGVIGNRSLSNGKWVKRTPADIYWSGLRNYGIFSKGTLSLTEYIRAICLLKKQRETLVKLGNRNDSSEEKEVDDKDAGDLSQIHFWNIPTYDANWKEQLSIKLTPKEGAFLKRQIIISNPTSMMAHILKSNMTEVFQLKGFLQLRGIINLFPKDMQEDYYLASDFSRFLFVLRTLYNIIVSGGKNVEANQEWINLATNLRDYSNVDLEQIFDKLQIRRNYSLCNFLRAERELLTKGDIEGMKFEICKRESDIKLGRAKTQHIGEFDPDAWWGGYYLDYRFENAKMIIRDIFESEGLHVKSE